MAAAHTDLSFVLTGPETQARAGDPVHFSITGAQKLVSYELEVADTEVLEGSAVSGQFTMPDLGEAARVVTVEAELRGPGKKKTTVKRKLMYLGPCARGQRPGLRPSRSHCPWSRNSLSRHRYRFTHRPRP